LGRNPDDRFLNNRAHEGVAFGFPALGRAEIAGIADMTEFRPNITGMLNDFVQPFGDGGGRTPRECRRSGGRWACGNSRWPAVLDREANDLCLVDSTMRRLRRGRDDESR
jgi:hypothetical protein